MYKRIMIFGMPGSGKSTFAAKLGKKLNLPVYHLDRYYFLANWQKRNVQEFLDIVQDIAKKDKWIIDGNQKMQHFDVRWQRGDIIFYFNFPLWFCYWRVFKRMFTKDPHIHDRPEQCPERLSWSFLKYMWGFKKRANPVIKKLREQYPSVEFYEIKNDNDASEIIKNIS